ncbi:MAG: hypothetical protein PVJ27_01410 [Candidatus Brocadiaceae bacterium]|jgi:hypothetical protein
MHRQGITLRGLEVRSDEIDVRPATSREELEQAFRLVYSSYLQRGYIGPDPSGVRLSVFNALPGTVTFVSVFEERVIATVTVVPDTPMGLPMDEIYHREVQELRDAGRELAEVTMLADRRRELQRALPMLLLLMKCVFDYATLVLEANDLCITINPRHQTYYERYLLFKPLGELKHYPSVRNNPALAKRLDLDRVREECEGNQELVEHFFRNRTSRDLLTRRHQMTQEDLRYFLVELTSTLRNASPEARQMLRECYPACPWDEWLAEGESAC